MTPFRAIIILTSTLLYAPLLEAASLDDLRTLIQDEKYDAAYSLSKSMSEQESGHPDFDFLFGVAARKSGHPEDAIFALERVIMNNPDDAVATYERGTALFEVRDFRSAAFSFNKVLSLDADLDLKNNAQRLLDLTTAKIDEDQNARYISLQAAIDIGFSSNVNSGVNDIVEVPSGSPEVRDGYINYGVAALLKRKLTKKDSYFFSLSSSNRKYFRSINWDFNVFTARTGLEFAIGIFRLRLPAEAELILDHYEVVRIMPSLGFEFIYEWDKNNRTALSAKIRHKAYIDASNNSLSPRFALQHQALSLAPGFDLRGEVFAAPGFAYADTPGRKVKTELGTRVDAMWEFANSHLLIGSAQFLHMRFPVSSTPGAIRYDENFTARVGYEWHFAKNWYVGPAFLYFLNKSTDGERQYTRYQAQLGVRYEL